MYESFFLRVEYYIVEILFRQKATAMVTGSKVVLGQLVEPMLLSSEVRSLRPISDTNISILLPMVITKKTKLPVLMNAIYVLFK